MTQDLGTAVLTLTTDVRGVSAGIDQANAQLGRLEEGVGRVDKGLNFANLQLAVSNIGEGLRSISEGVSGALANLDTLTREFAYVNGQSQSIKTIFGEAADSVFNFSKTSAESVGLSSKAFEELIAPIGVILKNVAGLNEPETSQWAVDLATRASDLAFIFNTDVNQAINAIASAIRGETEPIERFGISFSDASVKAKALSMGLGEVAADSGKVENAALNVEKAQISLNQAIQKYGENSPQAQKAAINLEKSQNALEKATAGGNAKLTEQDKVLARLALIMEQSNQFAGAFAQGQDTAFVKAAQLSAGIDDLRGKMGAELLPVQNAVLTQFLVMPEAIQLAGIALATFGEDIVRVGSGLVQLGSGLVGLLAFMGPWSLLVIGIIAAVSLAFVFFRDDVVGIAQAVVAGVQSVIDTLGELAHLVSLGFAGGQIGGQFSVIEQAAFTLGQVLRNDVLPVIHEIGDAFRLFILGLEGGDIGGKFSWIQMAGFNLGQFLRNDLIPALSDIAVFIGQVASQVWPMIVSFVEWANQSGFLANILEGLRVSLDIARFVVVLLAEALSFLIPIVASVVEWLRQHEVVAYAVMAALAAAAALLAGPVVAGFLIVNLALSQANNAWEIFKAVVASVWDVVGPVMAAIVGAVVGGFNFIAGVISSVTATIVADVSNGWIGGIFNAILLAVNSIIALVSFAWPHIWSIISTVGGAILNFISDNWNTISAIIQGVLTAIAAFMFFIWDTILAHIFSVLLSIVNVVNDNWNAILSVITTIANAIWNVVQVLFDTVISIFSIGMAIIFGNWDRAWNELRDLVSRLASEIWDVVQGLFNGIIDIMDDLPGQLFQIGSDAIGELGNGMKSAADIAGGLFDKAKGIASDVISFIKSGFGIGSPSRLMFDIGVNLIKGLENGVAGKLPSLREIANQVRRTFVNQLLGSAAAGAISAGASAWIDLVSAFFPANEVTRALMVMQMESGGNPRAIGVNSNGTLDVGLFQINDVHGLSVAQRLDPVANVAFAADLWRRQGWAPWVAAQKLGFAQYGEPYVPQDMWYWLHEGERVLTAEENARGIGETVIHIENVYARDEADARRVAGDLVWALRLRGAAV